MFDERRGKTAGTIFDASARGQQPQQQQQQQLMQAVVYDPYRGTPKKMAEIHDLSARRPASSGQKSVFRSEAVLLAFKPRS